MLIQRVRSIVAIAQLIGLISTACSLVLDSPQIIDLNSDTFPVNNSSDVGLIYIPSSELNASSLGGSPMNLSLPLKAPGDLDYECRAGFGSPLPVACRSVYIDMPDFDRVETWGDRRNRVSSQVPLPIRMSSGEKRAFLMIFQ